MNGYECRRYTISHHCHLNNQFKLRHENQYALYIDDEEQCGVTTVRKSKGSEQQLFSN